MSSFDPIAVRQAVAAFTPGRPQKFQDLLPAQDMIAELRRKRASYRAIAELLTQHCLPISKTAIAAFCHQVLGEIVRPKRRLARKRPYSTPPVQREMGEAAPPTATTSPLPSSAATADPLASRPRGPRIAQVRMLTPKPV